MDKDARKTIRYQAAEENVEAWDMSFGVFDHGMCIIADKKTMKAIDGKTVSQLGTLSSAIVAFAVDVWLNTVCRVIDYPAQITRKLDTWTSAGKRICWAPDYQDEGWAVPNGDYRTRFLAAVISAPDLP